MILSGSAAAMHRPWGAPAALLALVALLLVGVAGPASGADGDLAPSEPPSASASASASASPTPTPDVWVMPLRKARITTPFGPYPGGNTLNARGRRSHDGIDFASFCGDAVRAAHAGVVVSVNRHYAYRIGASRRVADYLHLVWRKRPAWLPITVVIDHGDGLRTVYGHLSRVSVERGQRVVAGKVIGREGATGTSSTGCHLHFAIVRTDGDWSWRQRFRYTLTGPSHWGPVRERLNPARFLPMPASSPAPTPVPIAEPSMLIVPPSPSPSPASP